jgi:hypothetical protein
MKPIHIVGNGKSAALYNYKQREGTTYTCNLPPFSISHAKATFMVDFKMMKAIHSGSVQVPGDWVVGARPKKYTEMNPDFYLKYAPQIKEFYLDIPKYAGNYTNFNCGHMATYYCASKLGAQDIHMYGFDSIFGPELHSCTDFYLRSDRSVENSVRLAGNWRPIWEHMFNQFKNTTFHLHYFKQNDLIHFPNNVNVVIDRK